jgi:hypothetical protein
MAAPIRVGVVYRSGNPTAGNFTPREKDLIAEPPSPASEPGLSTYQRLDPDATKKQLGIQLDLLPPELCGFADIPTLGGIDGHVAIAPVTLDGRVDMAALREWAATRAGKTIHPFTKAVMRAAGLRIKDGE